jgi:hypothetical protein
LKSNGAEIIAMDITKGNFSTMRKQHHCHLSRFTWVSRTICKNKMEMKQKKKEKKKKMELRRAMAS